MDNEKPIQAIKDRLKELTQPLEPYIDVLLFVVCLLGAHFFWKFTVDADESGGPVYWFGMNISYPFDLMSTHIAHGVYDLVHLTRNTLHYFYPDVLRFDTGSSVKIVWSCTGLKQAFIWIVIMLFARGNGKRKLWFIPLGLLCIYLFNFLRIYLIVLIIEHHAELFDLMHSYIFKYLFYGMLFMLWVWWTEKLGAVANKRAS